MVGLMGLLGCAGPSGPVQGTPDQVTVQLTRYFTPLTEADPMGVPLQDVAGQVISAPIPLRAWCEASQEGSVVVVDGGARQAYSVHSWGGPAQADCSGFYGRPSPVENATRYVRVAARWGVGSSGRPLVPFRSVAVDGSLGVGNALFLPALAGRTLPDGEGGSFVHDGYVLAVDTGGAVKGSHVDLFVGPLRDRDLPGWLVNLERTPVQVVTDPAIRTRLEDIHR